MPMLRVKFQCPNCQGKLLEEVVIDAVIGTQIIEISEDGDEINYGKPLYAENGHVDRYQCNTCGLILRRDEDGEPCALPIELFEWLTVHNQYLQR
jgi:hypothetical protein